MTFFCENTINSLSISIQKLFYIYFLKKSHLPVVVVLALFVDLRDELADVVELGNRKLEYAL